ncbi:MAG: hypothetical protein LBT48_08510 [Prevotellaceae bacterium]|jgi:translation elongation factor EF-Tu-like GTPase|nr:hypothetical protein [Prevotellaceae bacterium]
MNCPKCKNPIEDNATVCEWCGATIVNNITPQFHPFIVEKSFIMIIEGVFSIVGRGTIVIGCIEKGIVRIGDELNIIANNTVLHKTKCIGIEKFRKQLKSAEAGNNVGILLQEVSKKDIAIGMIVTN